MKTENKVIYVAMEIGKYLLHNGAEVSRVEDTMMRILKSYNCDASGVLALPTGIIVTSNVRGDIITALERTYAPIVNLEAIDKGNTFSRKFISGEITLDTVDYELKKLKEEKYYSVFIRLVGGCIGGGFWTILFGGNMLELILAFLSSGINVLAFEWLSKYNYNFFIKHIFGGFIAGLIGILSVEFVKLFGYSPNLTLVIVGPLMTLVPGVAITNGMRDVISGELVTGSAIITEAVFTSIALAFGIGLVLKLFVNFI